MKILIPEYILTPKAQIVGGMAVVISDDGYIHDVISANDIDTESNETEKLEGLLLPGLINCHTHLELSWCKEMYPKHLGMQSFYGNMQGVHRRRPAQDQVLKDITDAIVVQSKKGTVAMADICNTDITLEAKKKSGLYFHSFIETFGTNPKDAKKRMLEAKRVQSLFDAQYESKNSLSAHTLFTVSDELAKMLYSAIKTEGKAHSIHFMESTEELEFFEKDQHIRFVHDSAEPIPFKKNTAVDTAIAVLPKHNRVLFVHNTLATANDIDLLLQYFENAWFCLCPASNQFITGLIPPASMLFNMTTNVVLGTDSLASNEELDLFREIDILLNTFPEIEPETLLHSATQNGAVFLGIEKGFGSITPNKKPGLVLIKNYFPGCRKFSNLEVRRLY